MRRRFQPWLLLAGLILLCGAGVAALFWYRARIEWNASAMASFLPRGNSTVLFVDFGLLRHSGVLDLIAGSKALEELDYRKFVEETGFDYRNDLDRVAIAFQGDQRLAVAAGRFNWKKINQFTRGMGGSCLNGFCDYKPAEVLSRTVSYYPVRPGVMGLYSGPSDWGIYLLPAAGRAKPQPPVRWPDAPVWILVPASQWSNAADLPAGTKAFASVFAESQQVVFSVNAEGENFKLFGDLTCGDSSSAERVTARLQEATDLLKKMMAREKKIPNRADLTGLLTGGTFQREDTHVKASWPFYRELLQVFADGGVH